MFQFRCQQQSQPINVLDNSSISQSQSSCQLSDRSNSDDHVASSVGNANNSASSTLSVTPVHSLFERNQNAEVIISNAAGNSNSIEPSAATRVILQSSFQSNEPTDRDNYSPSTAISIAEPLTEDMRSRQAGSQQNLLNHLVETPCSSGTSLDAPRNIRRIVNEMENVTGVNSDDNIPVVSKSVNFIIYM
jgi:hypothetical protein